MIHIIHRFTCTRCGKEKDHKYPYLLGTQALRPTLPSGWQVVDGKLICNDHIVKIEIKDKTTIK